MPAERVLGSTRSLCPECLRRIGAWNVRRGDDVFLVKECPEHGRFSTIIWRGAPDYEQWGYPRRHAGPRVCATTRQKGCPFDCGLCPEHHHSPCAVLLEVTGRCNLRCPVCFADAGRDAGGDPGLEEIAGWYKALQALGQPVNIQLSGGEPSVRDDLPEIIALARAHAFDFVQLNTNGIRLGSDPAHAQTLKEAGLDCAFVQFDGLDDAIYRAIRGRELLQVKLEAVRNCARAGIGVVLAVTLVHGVNMDAIGPLVDFALSHVPHVRGLHFQPMGYLGRYPHEPDDARRITLPEVMRALEEQTGGRLRLSWFLPPAGENAHCSFHANVTVLADGSLQPWVDDAEAFNRAKALQPGDGSEHARRFMARQWSAAPQGTPGQDELGRQLERMQSHSLCISGMAFQDVWNLDLERLRDCHIGILAHDARIVPFCAYNLGSRTGRTLYRRHIPPTIPYDAQIARRLGLGSPSREALRAALDAYRLDRLNRTLVHARAHSPFYGRRLQGIGLPLHDLAQLAELPFMDAQDVREQGLALLCVGQGEISRAVTLATSGTTGEPKQFFFTGDDQQLTLDIFRTSMQQVARAGESCHVLLPCASPGGVGDLLCRAIADMGARPVPCGPVTHLPDIAARIAEEESCTLVGIPSQVLALARHARARGCHLPVRSALLCTDHVPAAIVRAVADIWNCSVYEYYGMTEACYAGGMECAAHDGCHVHEADLLVEVIDPHTGAVLPDGEYGEVVITTLLRRGMPLVRYRTGDVSRFVPGPCACGSVLRRLEKVRLRKDCRIALGDAGHTLSMAELDEALWPLGGLLRFEATILEGKGQKKLVLDLGCMEAVAENSVRERLQTIPDLAAALHGGALGLDIRIGRQGDDLHPTGAKRQIRIARDVD